MAGGGRVPVPYFSSSNHESMENTLQGHGREDCSLGDGQKADLTKLAFSLVTVFLAYGQFAAIGNLYLSRFLSQPKSGAFDRALWVSPFVYNGTAVFVLLEMLIVLWVYWPVSQLFKNASAPTKQNTPFSDLAAGIGIGFAGFFLTIPLLWGTRATPLIGGILSPTHSISTLGALTILLFGLVLPVVTEMVFRGIVQRTLQSYMKPLAAILVSAVLFARLWSVFSFPFALVLGLASGLLYRWRASLLACIIANAVMTVSAGAYVAFRIWS